ncbi:MAG: hypothetical protein KatS3mg129_2105 [Leptospiraceae bacterium]|nr:MAG: hypothetical protein KatS3mg129_2105 [Leptospiraceae bacterium]
MKFYKLIFISFLMILSCSTVNEVVNPLQNPLTSWIFDKSCISVDVPPITLTSEKTAIEKQILGEKTELYPDGWLIISSNYVSVYQEQISLEPEIKKHLETLSLYKDAVEYYMIRDYIGIDTQGNFLIVPDRYRTETNFRQLEIAIELVDIMNFNKNKVYYYLLKKDKKLAEDFSKRILKSFQDAGWNYDSKLGWYKK